MKNIKNFNQLLYNSVNESLTELKFHDTDMYSNNDSYKYVNNVKKVMAKSGVELYFLNTYNLSIMSLYPIVNLMLNNKFDTNNVILITICALTILVHENKEKAQKLFTYASECNISQDIIDKVINQITNIKTIFIEISKRFDINIITFSDMLKHIELFTPFLNVLGSLIMQNKLSSEILSLPNSSFLSIFKPLEYKLLIHRILHKLCIIIKGTDKFQNSDNIRPLTINDDFKSPLLRPYKVPIINKDND